MELYIIVGVIAGIFIGALINLGNILLFRRRKRLIAYRKVFIKGTTDYAKIESRTGTKYIIISAGIIFCSALILFLVLKDYFKAHNENTMIIILIITGFSVMVSYYISMQLFDKNEHTKQPNNWL